jgi:hypothetical protein
MDVFEAKQSGKRIADGVLLKSIQAAQNPTRLQQDSLCDPDGTDLK